MGTKLEQGHITGQDEAVHRTEGRTVGIRASETRPKASIQLGILSPALIHYLCLCLCPFLCWHHSLLCFHEDMTADSLCLETPEKREHVFFPESVFQS